MFGKFSGSSQTIYGKSAENLEKMILDKFRENDLSENCLRIHDKLSEYFRFCRITNYLLETALTKRLPAGNVF